MLFALSTRRDLYHPPLRGEVFADDLFKLYLYSHISIALRLQR